MQKKTFFTGRFLASLKGYEPELKAGSPQAETCYSINRKLSINTLELDPSFR